MTVGLDGSIYISGLTIGVLDGQTSSGAEDAFISKFNADGTKIWTKLLGTNAKDYALASATSLDGAIYITGVTYGALDGQVNSGDGDAFLTKYRADGSKAWTTLLGGKLYDAAQGITVGLDGSIYITGQTENSLDGQTNKGGKDAFLTKYTNDGIKVWTNLFGTSNQTTSNFLGGKSWDVAYGLTTGRDGSIYVAGYTYGSIDGQPHSGGEDAFLTKFNKDGSKIWTKLLGSTSGDIAYAVTTGLDDSIYVTGITGATAFDSRISGTAIGGQSTAGGTAAFLTKFNSDGEQVWTRLLDSSANDNAYALTTWLDGSVYVGGYTEGVLDGQSKIGSKDSFLSKFNTDGTKAWTLLSGLNFTDYAQALTTGLDGSIYMSGLTDGSIDGRSLGSSDAYLAKYQNSVNVAYFLSPVSFSVSEGSNAIFTVDTVNVPSGTAIIYTVSGVEASDITGGSLSGTVIINASGSATISIPIAADLLTEGREDITVTVEQHSKWVMISDTSLTPNQVVNTDVPFIPFGSGRYFMPSESADKIVGTAFLDVVRQSSNHDDHQIVKLTDGSWQIQNKSNPVNTDTLLNVERVIFNDVRLALDVSGPAGQVAKILGAVFGPTAVKNATFAGIGLAYLDSGMSYSALANLAAAAAGLNTPDALVSTLWQNVVGFSASQSEKAPFIKLLNDGMSVGDLVVLAADTSLNTQSIGLAELLNTGLAYHDHAIPSYALSAQASVDEGNTAVVILSTTNVSVGSQIDYVISGVDSNDLVTSLTGKMTVDASGKAAIDLVTVADLTTEGPETMTISLGSATAQVVIKDTSISLVGIIDNSGGGDGGGVGGGY